MDDISAGFVSGLNDELTEEENRRHWASLGNIAHRYPLNHELWDKMEDISIEGAALYSFGIDPAAIQLEMESPEDNALDELPKDFRERLSIIKSAVRAGTIKRVPINGSDPGGWDDHTRILKADLLKWCKANSKCCKPAEVIADYPEHQTEGVPTHVATSPSEDLSTRERETLLKIIIGMAVGGSYKYNPTAERSPVTGEKKGSIYADLEMAGVHVDADTIRDYIKEAIVYLPQT